MTDIVERLRARKLPTIEVDMHYPQIVDSDEADAECTEAADEIERLRVDVRLAVMSDSEECKMLSDENERLRAALGQIGRMKVVPDDVMNRFTLVAATHIARAALAQPAPEQEPRT